MPLFLSPPVCGLYLCVYEHYKRIIDSITNTCVITTTCNHHHHHHQFDCVVIPTEYGAGLFVTSPYPRAVLLPTLCCVCAPRVSSPESKKMSSGVRLGTTDIVVPPVQVTCFLLCLRQIAGVCVCECMCVGVKSSHQLYSHCSLPLSLSISLSLCCNNTLL